MKRKARLGSMLFRLRDMCRMVELEEPSAGVKTPLSRKDLILLRRRREDAEGERRMMGSGRRPPGFLGRTVRLGFPGMAEVPFCGLGTPGRTTSRRWL